MWEALNPPSAPRREDALQSWWTFLRKTFGLMWLKLAYSVFAPCNEFEFFFCAVFLEKYSRAYTQNQPNNNSKKPNQTGWKQTKNTNKTLCLLMCHSNIENGDYEWLRDAGSPFQIDLYPDIQWYSQTCHIIGRWYVHFWVTNFQNNLKYWKLGFFKTEFPFSQIKAGDPCNYQTFSFNEAIRNQVSTSCLLSSR